MKNCRWRFVVAVPVAFILFLSAGCAGGKSLRTQDDRGSDDITGLYTLILYRGSESLGGLKTVAFLAAEKDGYSLVPYAPTYEYTVTPHLSGQKALGDALAFIKTSRFYKNHQLRRILSPSGATIGYEVRPLYDSLAFGVSNIMTISYSLREGGAVQINIQFIESVRNQVIGEY